MIKDELHKIREKVKFGVKAVKGKKGLEKRPMLERFLEKIYKTESCWIWIASKNPSGYGQIAVQGKTLRLASRVSYGIFKGPIPPGMLVMHTCDNRPCVNPDHLILGTPKDNMQDMINKGRQAKPITHCRWKGHEFTPENTMTWGKHKARRCRICYNEYRKNYDSKKTAAASAILAVESEKGNV